MVTLREQIGQMLILGFSGTMVEEQSPVANWLARENLGGVILFDYDLTKQAQGKNLVEKEQIKRLCSQLKNHAKNSSFTKQEGLPPFIAIDYEGGAVDRLSRIDGFNRTKKASELASLDDQSLRFEFEKMAKTLQALGFNLNFAPVVDLNLNEKEGIVGKLGRSFSAEPSFVARIAKLFVEVFSDHGLSCCYKHFPGHGSAIGDTHQGFVDVSATFETRELEPYSLLLANNKSSTMIMTAHVINHQLDKSGLPATLSKPILTGLLRQELGFKGVIISDDLQMQAISNHFSVDEALSLTINAGADMLIFANQLGYITANEVIDKIEKLVEKQEIPKIRIEEAYQRILNLKQEHFATN